MTDEARVIQLEQELAACRAAFRLARSELCAAKKAVKEGAQTLHQALEAASTGHWTWDPAQERITQSHFLCAADRPSAEHDFSLIHPDDRQHHRARVLEAGRQGTGWHAKIRIMRPDTGVIGWIEERAIPQSDPVTGAVRIRVFVQDIGECKMANLAADRREADLAHVLRIGGLGGMDIDVANGLTAWRSPEYLELHGLPLNAAEEGHADWRERVHPDDRDAAESRLFEAIGGNSKTYDSHYRIVRANDGAIRWIHARADIERDAMGKALRLIGAHLDVTAEKEAREALRESREQQVFLLGLSDALRSITDPVEIRQQTVSLLGIYLHVDRVICYRAEPASGGWRHIVESEWISRPEVASIAGAQNTKVDFDRAVMTDFESGKVVVMGDQQAALGHASTVTGEHSLAALRGFMTAPLVDQGCSVAGLSVQALNPRAWTRAEAELVEEVAQRLSDALERARTQTALREREERLELAFEVGQLASWDWDLLSGRVDWNDRHFLMQGYAVAEVTPGYEAWIARVHPEDREETVALIERARDTHGNYVHEFRTLLPDGTLRWCCGQGHFFYDGQDRPIRMIGVMEDITVRKANQDTLRQSEERFQQFAAASCDALWIRNAQTLDLEYVSPAIETIYGRSAAELLGDVSHWAGLILPDDRVDALAGLEEARAGKSVIHEFRVERVSDGRVRWVRNTDFPLHDAEGRIVRIGGISQDMTDAKQAARHQDILLAELQHRVRNILAMTRSIADRSADGARTVEDYRQVLGGRLMAMARVQTLLTRQVNRGGSLTNVIESELRAQTGHERRYTLSGPDIMLSPKTVEVLTLVFHELATNAVKHGALATAAGSIAVAWITTERDDGPWLVLDWSEDGVRLQEPPGLPGFGSELIEMRIPYELQGSGKISFMSDGVRCHLELPLRGGQSILETDAPISYAPVGEIVDTTSDHA